MVEGFILKYNKRGGFFCKMVKRGKNSLGNRGKGKGFLEKLPSSSSSRRHGTEEGEGASAPVNPGGQGLDGGPEQGKREGRGR